MKKFLFFILLLVIINLSATISFVLVIDNSLKERAKPEKLDVIVILFADFTHDYKDLGKASIKRLNHAMKMSKRYGTPSFLCVGGSRPNYRVKGADMMKSYLIANGINENRVYADANSYDTRTNWQDAKILIEANRWVEVGVVSTPFHLYRFNRFIIGNENDFELYLLPHPIFKTTPSSNLAETWMAVNYEWIAYAAYLLPERLYEKLVGFIRPQHSD